MYRNGEGSPRRHSHALHASAPPLRRHFAENVHGATGLHVAHVERRPATRRARLIDGDASGPAALVDAGPRAARELLVALVVGGCHETLQRALRCAPASVVDVCLLYPNQPDERRRRKKAGTVRVSKVSWSGGGQDGIFISSNCCRLERGATPSRRRTPRRRGKVDGKGRTRRARPRNARDGSVRERRRGRRREFFFFPGKKQRDKKVSREKRRNAGQARVPP